MSGLVYRVENAEGLGMYRSKADYHISGCPDFQDDGDRHPCPSEDAKLGWSWDVHPTWVFGFASKEQLMFWLYKESWRRYIKSGGFTIAVYEVDDGYYKLGDTQACFNRDHAIRITNIDIVDTVTQVDVTYVENSSA